MNIACTVHVHRIVKLCLNFFYNEFKFPGSLNQNYLMTILKKNESTT